MFMPERMREVVRLRAWAAVRMADILGVGEFPEEDLRIP